MKIGVHRKKVCRTSIQKQTQSVRGDGERDKTLIGKTFQKAGSIKKKTKASTSTKCNDSIPPVEPLHPEKG